MWFDPQADREKMRRGRRLARLPDRRGLVLQLADCHRDVQYFCDPLRRSGLRAPGAIGRSRLDPDKREPYHNRGITNFYAGLLSQAAADLDRSIWLDIVDARSNRPSQFARAGPQLEMTKWPAPVIRLYLGQVTPGEVLAAADNPDAATKQTASLRGEFLYWPNGTCGGMRMPSSWGLAHSRKGPGAWKYGTGGSTEATTADRDNFE
jgi:hypothetical protein